MDSREPVLVRQSVATIVMNTEEQLRVAFEEYRSGRFIRHRS